MFSWRSSPAFSSSALVSDSLNGAPHDFVLTTRKYESIAPSSLDDPIVFRSERYNRSTSLNRSRHAFWGWPPSPSTWGPPSTRRSNIFPVVTPIASAICSSHDPDEVRQPHQVAPPQGRTRPHQPTRSPLPRQVSLIATLRAQPRHQPPQLLRALHERGSVRARLLHRWVVPSGWTVAGTRTSSSPCRRDASSSPRSRVLPSSCSCWCSSSAPSSPQQAVDRFSECASPTSSASWATCGPSSRKAGGSPCTAQVTG